MVHTMFAYMYCPHVVSAVRMYATYICMHIEDREHAPWGQSTEEERRLS